jgi:hypothetical protein
MPQALPLANSFLAFLHTSLANSPVAAVYDGHSPVAAVYDRRSPVAYTPLSMTVAYTSCQVRRYRRFCQEIHDTTLIQQS